MPPTFTFDIAIGRPYPYFAFYVFPIVGNATQRMARMRLRYCNRGCPFKFMRQLKVWKVVCSK